MKKLNRIRFIMIHSNVQRQTPAVNSRTLQDGLFACIQLLGDKTEDRDRSHKKDSMVELSDLSFLVHTALRYTYGFSGNFSFLIVCPGLNKESAQIWEVCLVGMLVKGIGGYRGLMTCHAFSGSACTWRPMN